MGLPPDVGIVSPEFQALCELIPRSLCPSPETALALETENLDWDALIALATEHRVLTLVYRALKGAPTISVPERAAAALRAAYMRATAHTVTIAKETARIAETLEGHGIRYIAVKGASLASLAYADPTMRMMRDIDLVVPPEDFAAACSAIEEAAYRQVDAMAMAAPDLREFYGRMAGEFAFRHQTLGTLVELHTRFERVTGLFPYSFDEIYAANARVDVAGVPVRTIPPLRHFVYVAIHGARHGWHRMSWVADIAAMILENPEYGTAPYLSAANIAALDLDRAVVSALYLAHLLFGTVISDEIRTKAQGSVSIRALAHFGVKRLLGASAGATVPERLELFLYQLGLQSRAKHRFDLVRYYTNWSETDLICFPLPSPLRSLYPWLAPVFWLARKFKPSLTEPYNRALAQAADLRRKCGDR